MQTIMQTGHKQSPGFGAIVAKVSSNEYRKAFESVAQRLNSIPGTTCVENPAIAMNTKKPYTIQSTPFNELILVKILEKYNIEHEHYPKDEAHLPEKINALTDPTKLLNEIV